MATLCAALFGFHRVSYVFQYSFAVEIKNIIKLLILILCLTLIGKAFAFSLNSLKKFINEKLPNNKYRIIILSLMIMMFMIFTQGRYSGSGENLIEGSYL